MALMSLSGVRAGSGVGKLPVVKTAAVDPLQAALERARQKEDELKMRSAAGDTWADQIEEEEKDQDEPPPGGESRGAGEQGTTGDSESVRGNPPPPPPVAPPPPPPPPPKDGGLGGPLPPKDGKSGGKKTVDIVETEKGVKWYGAEFELKLEYCLTEADTKTTPIQEPEDIEIAERTLVLQARNMVTFLDPPYDEMPFDKQPEEQAAKLVEMAREKVKKLLKVQAGVLAAKKRANAETERIFRLLSCNVPIDFIVLEPWYAAVVPDARIGAMWIAFKMATERFNWVFKTTRTPEAENWLEEQQSLARLKKEDRAAYDELMSTRQGGTRLLLVDNDAAKQYEDDGVMPSGAAVRARYESRISADTQAALKDLVVAIGKLQFIEPVSKQEINVTGDVYLTGSKVEPVVNKNKKKKDATKPSTYANVGGRDARGYSLESGKINAYMKQCVNAQLKHDIKQIKKEAADRMKMTRAATHAIAELKTIRFVMVATSSKSEEQWVVDEADFRARMDAQHLYRAWFCLYAYLSEANHNDDVFHQANAFSKSAMAPAAAMSDDALAAFVVIEGSDPEQLIPILRPRSVKTDSWVINARFERIQQYRHEFESAKNRNKDAHKTDSEGDSSPDPDPSDDDGAAGVSVLQKSCRRGKRGGKKHKTRTQKRDIDAVRPLTLEQEKQKQTELNRRREEISEITAARHARWLAQRTEQQRKKRAEIYSTGLPYAEARYQTIRNQLTPEQAVMLDNYRDELRDSLVTGQAMTAEQFSKTPYELRRLLNDYELDVWRAMCKCFPGCDDAPVQVLCTTSDDELLTRVGDAGAQQPRVSVLGSAKQGDRPINVDEVMEQVRRADPDMYRALRSSAELNQSVDVDITVGVDDTVRARFDPPQEQLEQIFTYTGPDLDSEFASGPKVTYSAITDEVIDLARPRGYRITETERYITKDDNIDAELLAELYAEMEQEPKYIQGQHSVQANGVAAVSILHIPFGSKSNALRSAALLIACDEDKLRWRRGNFVLADEVNGPIADRERQHKYFTAVFHRIYDTRIKVKGMRVVLTNALPLADINFANEMGDYVHDDGTTVKLRAMRDFFMKMRATTKFIDEAARLMVLTSLLYDNSTLYTKGFMISMALHDLARSQLQADYDLPADEPLEIREWREGERPLIEHAQDLQRYVDEGYFAFWRRDLTNQAINCLRILSGNNNRLNVVGEEFDHVAFQVDFAGVKFLIITCEEDEPIPVFEMPNGFDMWSTLKTISRTYGQPGDRVLGYYNACMLINGRLERADVNDSSQRQFYTADLQTQVVSMPRPRAPNCLYALCERALMHNVYKEAEAEAMDLDGLGLHRANFASVIVAARLSVCVSVVFDANNIVGQLITQALNSALHNGGAGPFVQTMIEHHGNNSAPAIYQYAVGVMMQIFKCSIDTNVWRFRSWNNRLLQVPGNQDGDHWALRWYNKVPYLIPPLSLARMMDFFPSLWGVMRYPSSADFRYETVLVNRGADNGIEFIRGTRMYDERTVSAKPYLKVSYGLIAINFIRQHLAVEEAWDIVCRRVERQVNVVGHRHEVVQRHLDYDPIFHIMYPGQLRTYDWALEEVLVPVLRVQQLGRHAMELYNGQEVRDCQYVGIHQGQAHLGVRINIDAMDLNESAAAEPGRPAVQRVDTMRYVEQYANYEGARVTQQGHEELAHGSLLQNSVPVTSLKADIDAPAPLDRINKKLDELAASMANFKITLSAPAHSATTPEGPKPTEMPSKHPGKDRDGHDLSAYDARVGSADKVTKPPPAPPTEALASPNPMYIPAKAPPAPEPPAAASKPRRKVNLAGLSKREEAQLLADEDVYGVDHHCDELFRKYGTSYYS